MADLQIDIKPLADCSYCASICAFWSYNEWYREREIPFKLVLKAYKSRITNRLLPQTYVALLHSFPIGMVTLKEDDLWSRKDLNPWLASLYVIGEYRNMGVGTRLITFTREKAISLGYKQLYLFLEYSNLDDLRSFYLKRDWNFLCDGTDNDGKKTEIMIVSFK